MSMPAPITAFLVANHEQQQPCDNLCLPGNGGRVNIHAEYAVVSQLRYAVYAGNMHAIIYSGASVCLKSLQSVHAITCFEFLQSVHGITGFYMLSYVKRFQTSDSFHRARVNIRLKSCAGSHVQEIPPLMMSLINLSDVQAERTTKTSNEHTGTALYSLLRVISGCFGLENNLTPVQSYDLYFATEEKDSCTDWLISRQPCDCWRRTAYVAASEKCAGHDDVAFE